MKKFWNWIRDETNPDARILRLEGAIAEESWFDDEVTPAAFKAELASGSGPITVWINSPGGDCVAAAQIYNMLMDYPSDVIVRIDGIAASAASVIAMAGTKVQMSPVSVMMIHNPLTVAMGDSDEMRRAIQLLDEVKESTINAFECLFREFSAACTGNGPLYNGYRLLDPDSYYSGENGQKPYGILHLNALFDLRQKVYVDAIVQKSRLANEHRALCDMVDRSSIDKAILLADRNYESYNDLAHLQEKGRKFLIRVKDGNSGIVSALPLPKTEAFDCAFQLSLTRRQTNEIKKRMKEDPSLKYIASSSPFDFLPSHAQKNEPCVIYKNLSFRVVRFHLTDSSFETVLTNLDASEYSPSMLKQLYAMRWGIETSFRDLKYTVGLASFHSKKVDHILQEVFARLTMYNFSELITACAVIRSVPGKLACQANFSAAVHIRREFFRGIVHPPDVEALIARFLSPVRPDRKRNRNLSSKGVVSFLYRIA